MIIHIFWEYSPKILFIKKVRKNCSIHILRNCSIHIFWEYSQFSLWIRICIHNELLLSINLNPYSLEIFPLNEFVCTNWISLVNNCSCWTTHPFLERFAISSFAFRRLSRPRSSLSKVNRPIAWVHPWTCDAHIDCIKSQCLSNLREEALCRRSTCSSLPKCHPSFSRAMKL